MSSRLQARGLTLAYDGRRIVEGLDLDVPDGEVTAIIGPNGCGKSTLLRGLTRVLTPAAGEVLLDGTSLRRLSTRSIATRLALLPQSPEAPAGITVADLVARGRHPHQRWFAQFSADDEEIVREAMKATGVEDLAHTPVEELSGGQRQRAWLSMTLAQQTDLVLLDEPTTYLDLAHQLEVLELIRDLRDAHGRTVLMVLHDISLALRYASHVVVMKAGRIVAAGPSQEVITSALLEEVFGLHAVVLEDDTLGGTHVLPLGLTRSRH